MLCQFGQILLHLHPFGLSLQHFQILRNHSATRRLELFGPIKFGHFQAFEDILKSQTEKKG
jgi:hypothetical protein